MATDQRIQGFALVARDRPLADYEMRCVECDSIARSEAVDIGVGYYVQGNFVCSCGWESDADGKMNVAQYEDYFS